MIRLVDDYADGRVIEITCRDAVEAFELLAASRHFPMIAASTVYEIVEYVDGFSLLRETWTPISEVEEFPSIIYRKVYHA